MDTCIIFGGSGFIGSHLAEELVRRKYEVKIFGTFQNGTGNLTNFIDNVELIKGDFLNPRDVSSALKDVDVLFHYISTTNPATIARNPVFDIETNVIGSVKLFQAALENDVKRIVYPSSGGTIYGETNGEPITESSAKNPIDPYAISKLTTERYLEYFHHTYGMKYTVFRYSNPFGERQNPLGRQGVIPQFLYKILHNEPPLIFGNGTATRDYIYIKDCIDATLAVLDSRTKETVFNVGSGEATTLLKLIDIMREVTGKEIHPEFITEHKKYISKNVLDISKIHQETGWVPSTGLNESIKKTWNWISTCFI